MIKLILLPWSVLRWLLCWLFYKGPAYDPAKWNAPLVKCNNNCYNYACDIETDTFAQPGLASGAVFDQADCIQVSAGAVADGLVAVGDGDACAGCCHRVALVIDPGNSDFHWYRLDSSGYWSHKPGNLEARKVDNSNQLITDPRTADRGPYSVFCGFFCVCKSNVHIQGYGQNYFAPFWC